MKKILYVILEQWADWELAYISSAVNMLGNGKFENKTLSLTKDAVTSIGGVKCLPDYDLQSAPSDYDALILIGGMAWHNENAMQIKPLIDDCIKERQSVRRNLRRLQVFRFCRRIERRKAYRKRLKRIKAVFGLYQRARLYT